MSYSIYKFDELINRLIKVSKSYNIIINDNQQYNIINTLSCIDNSNIDDHYDNIIIGLISALRYHTKYYKYDNYHDYLVDKFIFILENPDILL
jgi:hypothetical protein